MSNFVKGQVTLPNEDIERLQRALGILPDNINGFLYTSKVRRGEIERKRLSLVKAENKLPGQSENQELYRLCRYRNGFVTIGYALRSITTGDYFVFAGVSNG